MRQRQLLPLQQPHEIDKASHNDPIMWILISIDDDYDRYCLNVIRLLMMAAAAAAVEVVVVAAVAMVIDHILPDQ